MSNAKIKSPVRIANVQFEARKFESADDFEAQVRYFVEIAADYEADFVCFPEMFTLCLLSSAPKKLRPKEAVDFLSSYTARFTEFMSDLATTHKINIIGGSHFTRVENGEAQNLCYVFLRDGNIYAQPKIQATPGEGRWWDIKGGNTLRAIDTDCGKIGVLICYDSEFPELTRHLADQGALILFVPFCTDDKQGYNRVRYCAQARPIENQIYVVASGIVGNLPGVGNMDIHYAESCILTPCDHPFARDGIAAIAPANAQTVIFADLDMNALLTSREKGTVTNFKDRRGDLYRVEWSGE